METAIKYPNEWKRNTYKENRFRSDYGKIKARYTRNSENGFSETEDESYIRGYRAAIKDVKKLNKN